MIEEISASENKFLHLFMWILRQHMQNLGGGGEIYKTWYQAANSICN